jgi:putative molybdopterin biosynthesis protein
MGEDISVYLQDIPLTLALERFNKALADAGLAGILETETIPLDERAVGRVLAQPVWARLSSPHYHASAMDGFALRAEDTSGAMPTFPILLECGRQAVYLDTGDPLPDWANAVVPIEQVEALDSGSVVSNEVRHPAFVRIRAALPPWSHVRPMGEDIVATQLVLPAGQALRPVDLGAIAASGYDLVTVSRKPKVAILPTGSELVPVGHDPKLGEIIEYNSIVLAGQVQVWGGEAERFSITPDDFELLCRRVQQAADDNDLVLLNAGSSAGSEDYSARLVSALGELLVHGVAVRPGHPVILGMLRRSGSSHRKGPLTPVIGVPGYPVSAALTGEIFVEPLLAQWTGRAPFEPHEVKAIMTRKVTSPAGDDDYLRVVAGRVGTRLLAAPLGRGAGVITSLVRADGIVILPRGIQGLEAGSEVTIRLYQPLKELERTIFAIGSHDMTLDLLAQFLSNRGRRLVSANVGSQGGLVALRRGEAHLAGTHLLDPTTGQYNVSYLSQYLPETPVNLVTWVGREQGLLIQKGNPRQIKSLADLARPDVRYINRQKGAGTRVLLDFHLQRLGIDPATVKGYNQEEYTHLAVAAAVASNRADCGLGITAAARALDLDFIPLFNERYDLAIPCEYAESELLRPLFELMVDREFRLAVASLPGYDVRLMGNIVIGCRSI